MYIVHVNLKLHIVDAGDTCPIQLASSCLLV